MTTVDPTREASASSATMSAAWAPLAGAGTAHSSPTTVVAPSSRIAPARAADSTARPPPSLRPAMRPWYDQMGADGMRAPVERMKRLALELEPRALFSAPEVFSVEDEDGVELTSVVVDVFIPRESDGMAFRDSFFDRLVAALHPRDFERLAVGVGRLDAGCPVVDASGFSNLTTP